jgi:Holliday junction resolvasome RuvABC endonuclease subunit
MVATGRFRGLWWRVTAAASLPGLDTPPWSLQPARSILGIDPSTRRMSCGILVPYAERRLALAGEVAFTWSTLSLPQVERDEPRRLALAQAELVPWLGELLTLWAPELVVVEEPFAGTIGGALRVPKESYHVIGILLAVLGQFGVRVERVSPPVWKKQAMGAGAGGSKKPAPKCLRGGSHTWPREERYYGAGECLKCGHPAYAVLTWAREAGYTGALWDEADAIGMATAGGVLLDREARAA